MANSPSSTKPDWYLNSSRAKPLLAQPDRFYIDFLYNTLHNHLYHMDIDSILIDKKTLEPVAVLETIKGVRHLITPFKKKMYPKLAKRLGVPYYIVNWDKYNNIVTVTDGFTGANKIQTFSEHARWLRDLKYCTSPNATPHSECCDCNQCIPNLKV